MVDFTRLLTPLLYRRQSSWYLQYSVTEADAYYSALQDSTQQGQQGSIHPGLKILQELSATPQATSKELDNITSSGGHIASNWEPKNKKCLPFTSSYIYLDAYQTYRKATLNGQATKPSSDSYWFFYFQFVTECYLLYPSLRRHLRQLHLR
jgi:hypothetical protein